MNGNSTPQVKPAKARSRFPLFRHQNGRWCKKVRGQFCYFGRWADDPDGIAALQQWDEQHVGLFAGRKQRDLKQDLIAEKEGRSRRSEDGLTVAVLVDLFLNAKQAMVGTKELAERTWHDYFTVCERVVRVFGANRLASDLGKDDFARLRADFAKTRGPVSLKNDIARVRTLFKWGFDEEHIPAMRYGQSFAQPKPNTLRVARADNGERMFERHQLWLMLYGKTVDGKRVNGASQPLRTMILLAVNGGLGNSDIGKLQWSKLDLRSGWLNYKRSKTGIKRRIPLWDETIEALHEWASQRPTPKSAEHKDLVFITRSGGIWDKIMDDNPISKETAKLLKRLGLHRKGNGFYSLRRTFRTIASEAQDEPAARALMGHAPKGDDMDAVYIQRIGDDRLKAVTDHVHSWLFPTPTTA